MFFTYIIYSPSLDSYYVGSTGQLTDRLFRHKNSGSKSTKKANDWQLVFTRAFDTNAEAVQFEMEIKRKKRRSYIEWLIAGSGQSARIAK
ncbi:MAG TPA: GIY-YIG nuclease family protein [Bacteroidia bacterium]|nr:GIY-YIG nuclease family protein [Bacteroidia bacterium]